MFTGHVQALQNHYEGAEADEPAGQYLHNHITANKVKDLPKSKMTLY